MDFTKEQLSEVLCKHAERENGLQDLIGRNGPREDLRQLHRAHHPLGTPQDGGRHPRKRTQILVGIRHVSGNFASAEIGSFSFGRNRQN